MTGGGTTPRNKKAASFEGALSWEWWWSLNRERFINLKSALRSRANESVHPDLVFGSQPIDMSARATARARRMRRQIVPFLRRGVRDADSRVRAASLLALGKVADEGAVADVLPMLGSNLEVAESAILALGLMADPEGVAVLRSIAADGPAGRRAIGTRHRIASDLRAIAAVSLGLAGRAGRRSCDDGVGTLLTLVEGNEKNAVVNVAAALGLAVMAAPEAAPKLTDILEDESRDAYLRANAASALGKIGERAAMPALMKGLRDRDTQVRRSSALALGLVAVPEDANVVKALVKSARSGADQAKKNFAVIALGEIGGEVARNFLMRLVASGSVMEKGYAALALGVHGWKHDDPAQLEIAKLLRHELADNQTCRIRGACIIALGLLGDPEAKGQIHAIVRRHGHADLRIHGCVSLGMLHASDSIEMLHGILDEKGSGELRTAASIGLGLIGDEEATAVLSETIRGDAGGAIRGAAIAGIGLIGDLDVALGLGRMLTDRSLGYPDEVRAFAAHALGLLGDKDDIPALSRVSEDVNYTAQRGVLVKLLGRL